MSILEGLDAIVGSINATVGIINATVGIINATVGSIDLTLVVSILKGLDTQLGGIESVTDIGDSLVDAGDRLRKGFLVSVVDGHVKLLGQLGVHLGLQIVDLAGQLGDSVVDLLGEIFNSGVDLAVVVVLDGGLHRGHLVAESLDVRVVGSLGLKGSNGSVDAGDLLLEGGDLVVHLGGQIVNFLVYLLDVDFVVGTSGRKQGYSSKEQRCKFGEFDFHKVGMELKIVCFLTRWC